MTAKRLEDLTPEERENLKNSSFAVSCSKFFKNHIQPKVKERVINQMVNSDRILSHEEFIAIQAELKCLRFIEGEFTSTSMISE